MAGKNLNVKDALTYLDRVKVTFSDQGEVYDRFLGIMKDFKSQGIDTPGVIDRVSTLFRGHPALIQGFNTFLPPGYRIECSVSTRGDEDAVTTITVTTPMGMTTRTQVTGPAAGESKVVSSSTTTTAGRPAGEAPKAAAAAGTRPAVPASAVGADAAPRTTLNLPNLPPIPSVAALSVPTPIATPGAVSLLSSHLAPTQAPASMAAAAAAVAAAGATTGMMAESTPENNALSRPPMEFNHAINYVNKIKNRFVRDPETYKAFLEILQTYQKEGRAIQDVYAQVTTLFHAAPDLLDEFKQFLPDTSGDQAAPASFANQMVAPRATAKRPMTSLPKRDESGSAKKSKSSSKSKVDDKLSKGKRSSKVESKDARKGPIPSDGAHPDSLADPAMYNHHPHLNPYPPGYPVPSFPSHQSPHPLYAYDPPAHPPAAQPILPLLPQASMQDVNFFNRVKVYSTDIATYHEFLKLLNLYTQDILDLTALVSRAYLFIGQEASLWKDFREIVGWTDGVALGETGGRIEIVDGVRVIENVPSLDGPRRGKGDSGKGWKTHGPSYRQLPQSEISLNCSGRDALCWDVLNDEWVSQPSWASDEGFVAHRKNPYEEALHRSEEERHEYDYHIEANLRTIALLEPIATRIAIMEADERATFRLKPGLGNQSKSIYQRVIKKVYGSEQGGEVIQALHENPCVAVPIVLARLKQKDDEWKRALREWNRVWRDVDAKNFWKSLDHQAISLKVNDKRSHTSKQLVIEIETIKREQRHRTITSHFLPTPRTQLRYDISQPDVLADTLKLVFCYLDRTPTITNADKDKLDVFLRRFLPLVFAMSPTEFALMLLPVGGTGGDDDGDSMDGTSDAGTSAMDEAMEGASVSAKKALGKKTVVAGDLRKKVLKGAGGTAGKGMAGKRSRINSPAPSSRGTSPAPSVGGMEVDTPTIEAEPASTDLTALAALIAPLEVEGSVDVAMGDIPVAASTSAGALDFPTPMSEATPAPESVMGTPELLPPDLPELIVPVEDRPRKVDERKQWNLFANSNMYCLLRIVQIIYSRLTILKKSAVTLSIPPIPQQITPSHVPSLSLSNSVIAGSGAPPAHYYQRALGLCERWFDGDIDQPAFEEGMRHMFGTQGYILFTMDKLLHGVMRQSQACVSDSRSQDLVDLLAADRSHPDRSTTPQQTFYRSQSESLNGHDENLYRFEWIPATRSMGIQLLGKDSIAADDMGGAEREWGTYLEQYVRMESTPGPGISSKPYLARDLRKAAPGGTDKFPENMIVHSALQCRICLRSYKLFFVPSTEDYVYRKDAKVRDGAVERKLRAGRFDKWLEGRLGEKKVEGEDVKMEGV